MKYSIILFLVLHLSSLNLLSQHHDDDLRMIYVSAKAGLTSVIMQGQYNYGSEDLAVSNSLTPHIYLGYGLDYSTRNSYHIAIGYHQVAQSQNEIVSGQQRSKDFTLGYLSAPLSYKRVIGKKRGYAWKTINLYLTAGFQFDYLIHSSTNWVINAQDQSLTDYLQSVDATHFLPAIETDHGFMESYDDLYHTFDLKASLGAGFQYFITQDYLLYIEANYQQGFMDINNASWRYGDDTQSYSGVTSSGLMFSIGLNKYLKAF